MRISTFVRCEWDGVKYVAVESIGYEYSGDVALVKGEGTAKAQMEAQNRLQQQAFDAQMQRFNALQSSFSPYMQGAGIGYDPALKSALQAQFSNQTASDYAQAGQGIRDAILARGGGGQGPMSGSDIQGIMNLEASKANTLSQGTLGLGINNLQQALTNKINAGNILSGNAAALSAPVSTFGSGAANALNQYVQAANSGFGATFMKSLGNSLGQLPMAGLSAFTGGFTKPPGS